MTTLRFEDLRVRNKEDMDLDFFNKRFRLIAESIVQLTQAAEAAKAVSDEVVRLGLARINEVLTPALGRVQAASELGFLLATSNTSIQLSQGLETTFQLADTPANRIFTPTPYVTLMRDADNAQDDWAVARVQEYNPENLGLALKIVAVNGSLGSSAHDDWVVAASSGVVGSIVDQVVAAQQAASDAQAAADQVSQAAAIIASGPVASVNGKTGSVVLQIADIPSLVTTLAGKAAGTHSHQIGDVQNLQTALNGKASTTHGHAIADVTNLASTLTSLTNAINANASAIADNASAINALIQQRSFQ